MILSSSTSTGHSKAFGLFISTTSRVRETAAIIRNTTLVIPRKIASFFTLYVAGTCHVPGGSLNPKY